MGQTMVDSICEKCGKTYKAKLAEVNHGRMYCNNTCRGLGMRAKAPVRFWSQVNKHGPIPKTCPELGRCWEWTGETYSGGYGKFFTVCAMVAHRYAWELANGPIPKGLKACHKCDNRKCVNVAHIFLGTPKDNSADMVAKGRSIKGKNWHDFHPNEIVTGENNGRAKLTDEQVVSIRKEYIGVGKHPYLRELAVKYQVGITAIHDIIIHKRWRHIA